jgi:hypothetical protein
MFDKYTTYTLQNRLLNHYSDSTVIQPQQGQGKSNIVFSSSISIGDAIKAASKLKSDLKIAQIDLELFLWRFSINNSSYKQNGKEYYHKNIHVKP